MPSKTEEEFITPSEAYAAAEFGGNRPVGNLAGVARPTEAFRPAMRLLHGIQAGERLDIPLGQAMDEAVTIERLSTLMQKGLAAARKEDGTVDYRLAAAFLIKAAQGESS